MTLAMGLSLGISSSVKNVTAVPLLPALPVRPIRCMYATADYVCACNEKEKGKKGDDDVVKCGDELSKKGG